MAVTELYAGTEAITTDEWSLTTDTTTLATKTDDGVIQAWVDFTTSMARGDSFRIKAYEKVQSAGSQALVFSHVIQNQQSDPLYVAPAMMLMHGWDFSLEKLTGTDRTITWGIRSLGGTPTEYTEGSASMTTTEFFIASESTSKTKQTSAGIYQLFLDLTNLTKNDVFEVKCTEEARAADTVEAVAYRATLWGVKTSKVWVSPALALMNGWEFSIDRLAGSDRTIPYSIRKLA
jgi:hypothetical protein